MMRAYSFVFLGLLGCSNAARPAISALHYEASLHGLEPCVLDVDVDIETSSPSITLGGVEPAGLVSVEIKNEAGKHRAEIKDGSVVVDCRGSCRISYRYDLSQAAAAGGWGLDGVYEREGDVLSRGMAWLLRPTPTVKGTPVDLQVHVPDGLFFTSGLRKAEAEGHYALRSEELQALGFTAFGKRKAQRVDLTGGSVDVYVFPGNRRATDESIAAWAKQSGLSLDHIFGHFPMKHAAIFVVPMAGADSVGYGVMVPTGGGTIAVLLGEDTDDRSLLVDDWVLVHEMFHLGVPSFRHGETWLNEGLATYYEPLARTRAGFISADSYWKTLAKDMPRGVRSDVPLPEAHDFQRIYWGGAFLSMWADVEIRRRTNGKYSLDDGLRALLADGGDAMTVYSISMIGHIVDQAVTVPVFSELMAKATQKQQERGCGTQSSNETWPPQACASEAEALNSMLYALGLDTKAHTTNILENAALAQIRDMMVLPNGPRRKMANIDWGSEIKTLPFASTNNGSRIRFEEIWVMNQPHTLANLLR